MKKNFCVILMLVLLLSVGALCACDLFQCKHEFGEWTTVKDATCIAEGLRKHVCTKCEAEETEPIAALGHTDGDWTTDSEPTCTASGSKHQVCSVCGNTIKTESIDATGHAYSDTVVPPTCTTQGYTTHTCYCGYSYVDTYVDATGHTFGEWTVTTQATCTQKGQRQRTCPCGAVGTEPIAALGHTEGTWTTDSEPTCTASGSKHQVCSVCGNTIKTESIDATGHAYSDTVVSPTCTAQGYTLHKCHCGDSYQDTFVPTNGEHNFQEADTCAYCEENISTIAVESYNMSATSSDNVRGYVVPRANGKYDVYIKGTGNMKNYSSSLGDINPFYVDGYGGKLVNGYISNGVTSIGGEAFYGCTSLASVTIPNSVTSIGDFAFYACTSLASVTIPNRVTSIGGGAFESCLSLASITIEGTPEIGIDAFHSTSYYENANNWQNKVLYIGNCLIEAKTTIETCTIKEGTTVIADYAFDSCTALTQITIPENVTSIGKCAFLLCTNLSSVTFEENSKLQAIGDMAFNDCTALTQITIPNSVVRIGDFAFYGCTNLSSVTFEDPNGWYCTLTANATSGTTLTLTNAAQNATYLKDTYRGYYWYKSTNE